MKKLFVSLFSFVFFQFLTAQNAGIAPQREVVTFGSHQLQQAVLQAPSSEILRKTGAAATLPLKNNGPFLAYSIVWYSDSWDEKTDRMYGSFHGGTAALHLHKIYPDIHAGQHPRRHVSELYFLENDANKFVIEHEGRARIDSIAVHFYNPGFTDRHTAPNSWREFPNSTIPQSPDSSSRSLACTCPQPDYEGRLDWCPSGNCPPDPTPVPTDVSHLIVHHSAGVNTSSDWAAVVRSIWDFHVNVNGWDDVGYNWLVDPNGVLYEGRGDNMLGAHFCGKNGGTMGVCVLGDFTGITPTGQAIGTLEELLTWKCCDEDLDPLGAGFHASSGLTLDFISGHRDGCSTSCPGDSFYPLLPNVRQGVQNRIENDCEVLALPAPTQLTAIALSFDEVELAWLDNAISEDGYVLERSKSFNNNYQAIATLPANSVGFTDLTVEPSTGYFYRVKAVEATISSPYSNEVFVATGASAANEKNAIGTVKITPNPTRGIAAFFIDNQWIGRLEATVFDATGRQVARPVFYEKNTERATFEMDLTALPAGVFWVKIVQGEAAAFFKLLKI